MKAQYVIAQKEKDFLRIYDEYMFVTFSLNLEEARFAKARLDKHDKKKAKIYKLVEMK